MALSRTHVKFIKEGNSISDDNFKERIDFSLMSLTTDSDFSKTKKDISLALAEGLESITRIIRAPYSDEAVEVRSVVPNVAEKKIITLTEAIEHYGVPKKAKDRKWRDDCKFPTLQNEKGCSVRVDVEELNEWQRGRK